MGIPHNRRPANVPDTSQRPVVLSHTLISARRARLNTSLQPAARLDEPQQYVYRSRVACYAKLAQLSSMRTVRATPLAPAEHAAINAEVGSGEPGVTPEICDYLAEKKISMIDSDTWGLEPYDFEKGVPESFAYCHINLTVRRGITNFENLDLSVLSQEKAYEFLFTWAPLKLVGATGSPGNPTAAW